MNNGTPYPKIFSKRESLIIGITIWNQYLLVSNQTITVTLQCQLINTATIGMERMIGYLVKYFQTVAKFLNLFMIQMLSKPLEVQCIF